MGALFSPELKGMPTAHSLSLKCQVCMKHLGTIECGDDIYCGLCANCYTGDSGNNYTQEKGEWATLRCVACHQIYMTWSYDDPKFPAGIHCVSKNCSERVVQTKAVLIRDASGVPPGPKSYDKTSNEALKAFWWTAAKVRLDFNYDIGAKSWDDAFKQLGQIAKIHNIWWVEFWGHGNSGKAFIGNEELTLEKAKRLMSRYNINSSCFSRGYVDYTPLFWFRTCSTAKGYTGKRFIEGIAKYLDINVYGHSKDIGMTHGGICCSNGGNKWRSNIGSVSCVASRPE